MTTEQCMRDALELALKALCTSEPKMKHYSEPCARHTNAIEAVKEAITLHVYGLSNAPNPTARRFEEWKK